jgi:hypothetical protein
MATTTNYSWSTPDDTALVKDGAAAIRSLGTAIDSTVFTNAGAAIAKTIVDAKGDIIAATAADTVSRLAVGTNGQYLAANSSTATGLEWQTVSAGGMTLLSTTTLSGSSTSITSISQDYTQLYVTLKDVYGNASADRLKFNFNTDTTSGNYYSNQLFIDNATTGREMSFTNGYFGNGVMSQQNTQLRKLNGYLKLHNYTDTGTKWADMSVVSMSVGTNTYAVNGGGIYIGTSAISSIQVGLTAGTFTDGTVLIYGVK